MAKLVPMRELLLVEGTDQSPLTSPSYVSAARWVPKVRRIEYVRLVTPNLMLERVESEKVVEVGRKGGKSFPTEVVDGMPVLGGRRDYSRQNMT